MSERQQIHVHIDRVVADRRAVDSMGAEGVAAAIAAQVGARLPNGPRRAALGGALEGQITTAIANELRASSKMP